MGQKGYCCALLLVLCLLLGATEFANAQDTTTEMANDTTTEMANDTTTEMMTETTVTTDTPTTMPPPVNISEGNYPPEAVVVLTITLGDNFTRDDIGFLGILLQGYARVYCEGDNETNMTFSGLGSGSGDDCTTIEGSMTSDVDYEVVYIEYQRLGNNMVELQFVVLTTEGAIDVSSAIYLTEGLTLTFDILDIPVVASLLPQTTPESTDVVTMVTTDEVETTDGVPLGLIVGVVVGVGVPLIILVVVVVVIVVVVVVMKKKSKTAVKKIAPAPSKSEPPKSSTTHGSTVPMEKFPKSDK